MEKSFDRVADIYDDTRRMPPEAVARIMENIMNETGPSGGPVLELGIGTGRIAIPLAERGFRMVGVDIAEKMLLRLRDESAAAPHGIRVVRGDVAALPFADGSFSAAIAVHVFHLLDEVRACVSEARRVLSRGGCLFFGGEQRLLRYVQQVLREKHGFEEDLTGMLTEAGIKLPDQDEVERKVLDAVDGMGGELTPLAPVKWDHETTCAELVGRIERRTASYLWSVPEDGVKSLVERLRAALATHVGPPSTVIRFRRRFDMFCARF